MFYNQKLRVKIGVESLMREMLRTIRFRILDFVAPIDVWVTKKISFWAWAYFKASYLLFLDNSKKPHKLRRLIKKSIGLDQWWLALVSVIVIIFLPQVILIQDNFHSFYILILGSFISSDFLSVMWQVAAALISLSLVIAIFLVEFVQQREYGDRFFNLFLANTRLLFTILFGLISIFSFGLNALLAKSSLIADEKLAILAGINFLIFLADISLLASLYIRTLRFISPQRFKMLAARHNKEMVEDQVEREIKERIQTKILRDFCTKNNIDLSFSVRQKRRKWSIVNFESSTNDVQFVTDVNLHLLSIASSRLRELTHEKMNFSAWPRQSRISKKRARIAQIPEIGNRKRITLFIEESIKTFPVKQFYRGKTTEELQIYGNLMTRAISEIRIGDVSDVLDEYEEMLSIFLKSFQDYEIKYGREAAGREGVPFEDWSFLTEMMNQLGDFLEIVFKKGEHKILNEFLGFPFHIMSLSFLYGDHLVFRRFGSLYVLMINLVNGRDDIKEKQYITQRLIRQLFEFLDYMLMQELDYEETKIDEFENLGDYFKTVITYFSDILKSFLEVKEFKEVKDVLNRMATLRVNNLLRTNGDPETIRLKLENLQDETERQELNTDLARALALSEVVKNIIQYKKQMAFGLAGWITHMFEQGKLTEDEFINVLDAFVREFGDIKEFYNLYSAQVPEEGLERDFGWGNWELNEGATPYETINGGFLSYSSWQSRFYALWMIRLAPLALDKTLILSEAFNSQGILDELRKNLETFSQLGKWKTLAERVAGQGLLLAKIEVLLRIHTDAATKTKQSLESKIIDAELLEKPVNEFAESIYKTWNEEASLRAIVREMGQYELRNEENPDVQIFGVKTLVDKDIFTNLGHVAYLGYGEHFGRSLVAGEDGLIISTFKGLSTIQVGRDTFLPAIGTNASNMMQSGQSPIMIYSKKWFTTLHEDASFSPGWRNKTKYSHIPGFDGMLGELPVFSNFQMAENTIFIVDISSIGKLTQYAPNNSGQFPLFVKVTTIDEAKAQELFESKPELAKEGEKQYTGADAIRYLRLKVLLDIWEKLEFEIADPQAGVKLEIVLP